MRITLHTVECKRTVLRYNKNNNFIVKNNGIDKKSNKIEEKTQKFHE